MPTQTPAPTPALQCVVNVAPECPARGQLWFWPKEPYEKGAQTLPVCSACFGFLCRREMERKEEKDANATA